MNTRHYLLFTLLKIAAIALVLLVAGPRLFAQSDEADTDAQPPIEGDPSSSPLFFDNTEQLDDADLIAPDDDPESAFGVPSEIEDEMGDEDLPPEPLDSPGAESGVLRFAPGEGFEEPELPATLRRLLQGGGGLFSPDAEREGASIAEQQETIDKAILDLENNDPNIRQSATMILGKYRLSSAREALMGALDDPAAQVRQSALVALLEDPMQLGTREMLQVLTMIDDEDVHIRRLATSAVAQWMPSGLLMSTTSGLSGPLRSSPYSPELRQKIQQTFRDDDLTVRRNITAAYPALRMDLGDAVYQELLTDSDREIRMNMVQGLMSIHPEKLIQLAGLLIEDPDVTIRRELTAFLSSFMVPGVEKHLAQLANDEDFVVRQRAQLALYQLDPKRETLEPLLAQLNDQRTSKEMAGRIVYSITSLEGDQPREILENLLKDPQPKYLPEVLQLYSSLYRNSLTPDLVLRFTDDSSSEVRNTAMSALHRIPASLEQQHLERLLQSRFPDVREQITTLTRGFEPQQTEDILFELLLDEDDRVRISALREMATRRIPGWQEVLARSLDDPNPELVQMAILLFTGSPEPSTVTTLREFAERTEDPKLQGLALAQAHRLERELQNTPSQPSAQPAGQN